MVQPEVLRRFAETFESRGFRASAFVPSYGLAEATLAFSFSALGPGRSAGRDQPARLFDQGRAVPVPAGSPDAREIVICGKPLPGHQAEVRDHAGACCRTARSGVCSSRARASWPATSTSPRRPPSC